MENKEKTYYNRSALINATRKTAGEYKILELAFNCYDWKSKEFGIKRASLFLTADNNEKNQDTLKLLGVKAVPAKVTFDACADLDGLGDNVVDLVAEQNGEYMNIKFINEPRFPVKVFEATASKSAKAPDGYPF